MTIEEFEEITIINDLSFYLNGIEYFIFLLNDGYHVGRYDKEDEYEVFGKGKDYDKDFEDMIGNWIIDGKPLKELIDKIEINY